uniref:Uncharacterized protein n=1 Tax=Fagus sylvatica TaxID=28930 RepID=A0A2N9HX52_FAGSY
MLMLALFSIVRLPLQELKICTATSTVRPATTTAHKRPTPRPRREGDTHPAGHAAKERTTPPQGETHPTAKPCRARSQRSGGHPSVPISAWTSGLAPNEFELAKKGITGSGARPGGGGAVPFGG